MRCRAVSIVEELLVVVGVLLLLVAAHYAKDAATKALARLLGLIAVMRCVSSSVVAHDA